MSGTEPSISARKAAQDRRRAEMRALAGDDPLLSPQEAAAEAGIALSTWWKGVKEGRFPAPVRPTPRCPRWRRSAIRSALQGGEAS